MPDHTVQRRGLPGWLVAVVAVLFALAMYMLVTPWLRPTPVAPGGVAGGGGGGPWVTVAFGGHTWVPAGDGLARRFPADEMVAVGEHDGRTLWANRVRGLDALPAGGGGGGARPAPAHLETGAYHRIYVRLDDGRYLPLAWRDALPADRRTR